MYIEPSTNIKFYHNVPLDNTYVHTIYFNSLSEQNAYFHGTPSIVKVALAGQSYQRVNRGVIRVGKPAEMLYDCNYLAFQNERFGSKWFYAFVTSVEYVNNEVCQVTYQIDPLQTYWSEVTLLDSFVEREHSDTDVAGDNILTEPVAIGEYYNSEPIKTGFFDVLVPVIATTLVPTEDEFHWKEEVGQLSVSNNPTVLNYYAFKYDNQEQALQKFNSVISSMTSNRDINNVIIDTYMIPSYFIRRYQPMPLIANMYRIPEDTISEIKQFVESKPTTLGNYEPRNKKLLTYPYTMASITTLNGDSKNYAYEFFRDGGIAFKVYANLGSACEFKAVPLYYKGKDEDFTEGVMLENLPPIGYLIDTYKTWLSRNKTRLAIQGISAIAPLVSGASTYLSGASAYATGLQKLQGSDRLSQRIGQAYMNIGSRDMDIGSSQLSNVLPSSLNSIAGLLSSNQQAIYGGTTYAGSVTGSVEVAMQQKDFLYVQKYVNEQNAKMIDMFFDMFGYTTCKLKVPNRHVRERWTYVKTLDINLQGNCPADDLSFIASIYNKGITFWSNPSEVGKYTNSDNTMKSNRPLSERSI